MEVLLKFLQDYKNLNGVEEIYVLCNRVRWHAAYLPEVYANNGNVGIGQDRQSLQGTTSDDDEGSFNVDTEDGKPLSWQTKSTLTQLDDQIAAFDQALDLRDEACFESDSLEKSGPKLSAVSGLSCGSWPT